MTDVGTAALQIIPSFRGFQGHLEQGSAGAMIAAGRSGGDKYGAAAGRAAGSSFGRHAKAAILGASALVFTAAAAGIKIARASIDEAREAEKVGAITEARLRSTGGAANVSAKQVGDYATKLSLISGIDDEVIQSGENMLLTFKGIADQQGKNNDIFGQATAITTDLAVSMAGSGGEVDLKSASVLVGKALNDPTKGLTALTRVGVTFTDQQKKQIETLVKSGDTLGAQKVLLKELNSEFGGTARAQATAGDKMKVAFGNLEEQIGGVLLPLVDKFERFMIHRGIPAISGYVDTFEKKGVPALKHFYEKAKPVVEDMLPKLGDTLGTVRDVLADAAPYAKDLVDAFNDMPDWAKKAIVGGALGGYAAKKTGLLGATMGAGNLLVGGNRGGGLLGGGLLGGVQKVFVTNPGFGGNPDVPGGGKIGSGLKGAALAASRFLGPLAIPAGGLLVPSLVKDPTDLSQDAGPGGSGSAMTLPSHAINFADDDNYKNYLKATGQMSVEARARIDEIAAAFKTLPPKLQTDIVMHGAPESKREARALAKQYDLTAVDRKTLFATSGIPTAQNQTTKLLQKYGLVAKPVTTKVSATGVLTATQQVSTLLAQLHALTDHGWNFTALGSVPGGGSSGGSSGKSSGGSSGRGKPPVQVNIHVGGEKVGSIVTDQITANDDLHSRSMRAAR